MSDLQDDMVLEIDPGLVLLVAIWHSTHELFVGQMQEESEVLNGV
jgi:hypothetical protein